MQINNFKEPSVAYFFDGYVRNFCVQVIEDVSETPGIVEAFQYERHFSRSREMLNFFNKMCTKSFVIAARTIDKSKFGHNMFSEKTYHNPKYL